MVECTKKYVRPDLIEKVKKQYPDLRNLNTYTKDELCNLISHKCARLGGFQNEANSCYLDSVIIALFHFAENPLWQLIQGASFHFDNLPNEIDHEGTKRAALFHKTFKDVVKTVRGGDVKYCVNLRKAMKLYDKYYSKHNHIEALEWRHSQLEPSDFINFLYRVYDLPNTLSFKKEVFGSNCTTKRIPSADKKLVSSEQGNTTFSDILIDAQNLMASSVYDLKTAIPRSTQVTIFEDSDNAWTASDGAKYIKRIEKRTLLSGDLLFVHISRIFGDDKQTTPVTFPERIKLKDNSRNLYLRSIIVHHGGADGGHYTCFIKCKSSWLHYDDLAFDGNMKRIGSFDKLQRYKKAMVLKNCTNLVYA